MLCIDAYFGKELAVFIFYVKMAKIEKITKAIVHAFSILDIFGRPRNQTVFYQNTPLYVLVTYTKISIRN